MRLCTPVSLCLAAAAALGGAPAPAHAEAGPGCAGPVTGDFPLTTRLHGGPASYRAGGGFGTWYLDLTNTTGRTCTGVHPVVVLVDAERSLKPSQPHLEFYADGRPHPVHFETTDEDELVGALTDRPTAATGSTASTASTGSAASTASTGFTASTVSTGFTASNRSSGSAEWSGSSAPAPFAGFTVPPHKTLTVKLRLALTSDTVPNEVTVNAAVVQRHGDDGEWIGQSNDYRFTVEAGGRATTRETAHGTAPGTGTESAPKTESETESETGSESATDTDTDTATDPSASASASTPAPATGLPYLAEEAREMARTGLASPAVVLAATAGLLAAGVALLLARRRR
ncbi:hypothetical protein [Streptomyces sp. NPDC088812]|uniref:hypothetical protein n=1 Tax=Streptomyces sp. NPDC088812 TaxID=3365905 RepID=UPI003821E2EF